MPLYRCQRPECSTDPHGRLIFDFEADQPRCPKCGSDSRRPEHKFVVVKREVIHFHIEDAKGPDAGQGRRWRIACTPGGSMAGKRATGAVTAVTCPACRKTTEWLTQAAENDLQPLADFPIELDAENKTIVGTPPPLPAKTNDCGCGGGT